MGNKPYGLSSYSDEAMDDYAVDCRKLLQDDVKGGRIFRLLGISITETGGVAGTLQIYDYGTEGGSPTASLQRAAFQAEASKTTVILLSEPGIKFVTGMVAGLAAAGATIPAYGVSVWGVEE